MKLLFPGIFILTLCFLGNDVQAQKSDLQAIEKVLNDYMIGGTEKDAERVASAFHPQAMMKYIKDGAYIEVNAAEFFRGRIKPGPKTDRITEIANIDVSGHAATAKLLLKYSDKQFIDYMTLLKIKGEWKIINKTFFVELPKS